MIDVGSWPPIPDAETRTYEGPVDPGMCEYAGHEWAEMGGGMQVCMCCEIERETPDEGSGDAV